jgi:hypothetical protein
MNAQTFAPKLRQHFAGFILSRLCSMVRGVYKPDDLDGSGITIDQHQQNGSFGIHQARVRLSGDPTVYRLLLCPADAPVNVRGCPISEHFALPIGDA